MHSSAEKDRRRDLRVTGEMTISLVLRQGPGGPVLAGPSPGRLVNISALGASLRISRIFTDNHHLFYAPQENPAHILYLEFILAEEAGGSIPVPVRPVWFDRLAEEETAPFVMGVEFLFSEGDEQLRRLIGEVAERHREGGNWLRRLLIRFWPDRSAAPPAAKVSDS